PLSCGRAVSRLAQHRRAAPGDVAPSSFGGLLILTLNPLRLAPTTVAAAILAVRFPGSARPSDRSRTTLPTRLGLPIRALRAVRARAPLPVAGPAGPARPTGPSGRPLAPRSPARATRLSIALGHGPHRTGARRKPSPKS